MHTRGESSKGGRGGETSAAESGPGLGRRIVMGAGFVAGVAILGFGIPILWLLIAAEIQGAEGITRMSKTTAVAVFPGIIATYAAVMWLIGWFMARQGLTGDAPSRTRYPWLRSYRDEPETTEKPTSLEMVFIAAASLVSLAFMVWFFLWAGNPLPA